MNINDQWDAGEIELIREKLSLPLTLRAKKSTVDYRDAAFARYNAGPRGGTMSRGRASVKQHQRSDFDKYGLDLLTVKLLRHANTNYDDFCSPKPRTAVTNLVWLIGFIKAGNKIKSAFPELAGAVSYEAIGRVSGADRILLRDTILAMADATSMPMPIATYEKLQRKVVKSLNKRGQLNDPQGVRLDMTNLDDNALEEISNEIVSRFMSGNVAELANQLGVAVLDSYNQSLVRERIRGKALTSLADKYPELREACHRYISEGRETTAAHTEFTFTSEDLRIYTPSLTGIYYRVIGDYNTKFATEIVEGTIPRLYLAGAPETVLSMVRALAVWTLLSDFSRYDEFILSTETMPEPMASIQKDKIRKLFLEKIQEHYPELTEAIQAEIRILNRKSKPEPAIAA